MVIVAFRLTTNEITFFYKENVNLVLGDGEWESSSTVLYLLSDSSSHGFKVYWNIPTELCKKRHNISFEYVVKEFGITMNDHDDFKGNEVTILYSPGMFPEVKGYKHNYAVTEQNLSGLTFINGGLPQDGDLMKHLDSFEMFLNKSVPDKRNKGRVGLKMFRVLLSLGPSAQFY